MCQRHLLHVSAKLSALIRIDRHLSAYICMYQHTRYYNKVPEARKRNGSPAATWIIVSIYLPRRRSTACLVLTIIIFHRNCPLVLPRHRYHQRYLQNVTPRHVDVTARLQKIVEELGGGVLELVAGKDDLNVLFGNPLPGEKKELRVRYLVVVRDRPYYFA